MWARTTPTEPKAGALLPNPRHLESPSVALPLGVAGQSIEVDDSGATVRRSILPGGIRLITQQIPGSLSTALSFGVAVGSRDESPKEGGISHFLEHLLFKGTPSRSAFQIAEAFDRVGAESNASTAKESTFYWAHMVGRDLPVLLPVLADMVSDSVISEQDVEVERGVILDELAMSDDAPNEVAAEAFAAAVYGDTGLGRPVGGTPDSVKAQTAQSIQALYHDRYRPQQLVVSAAGAADHDELSDRLLEALSADRWGDLLSDQVPALRRGAEPKPSSTSGQHKTIRRDVEQAQLISGGQWLPALDPQRYASAVTINVLGGGMSSRLFQEIREKRGLAYSTYAFAGAHVGAGHFGMYAGCAPSRVSEVQKVMWAEVEKLSISGPSDTELERVKGQIRGAMTLRLEEMTARMWRLAEAELLGSFVSINEAIASVDAVEKEDVRKMAERMLATVRSEALVTTND